MCVSNPPRPLASKRVDPEQRGASLELRGASLELRGASIEPRGASSLELRVASIELRGVSIELLGASLELRGVPQELLGASLELSGASLELLGASLELSWASLADLPVLLLLAAESQVGLLDPMEVDTGRVSVVQLLVAPEGQPLGERLAFGVDLVVARSGHDAGVVVDGRSGFTRAPHPLRPLRGEEDRVILHQGADDVEEYVEIIEVV